MINKNSLLLRSSTALVGTALLFSASLALAGSNSGLLTESVSLTNDETYTNTGTISTSDTGILVGSGVSANSINNSGLINASNTAIKVSAASSLSGGISNTGLISASDTGIKVSTNSSLSGGISNSGSIVVDNKYGINIRGHSIVNDGITNESGGYIFGYTTGIQIKSSSVSGGISNNGTIESGGESAIAVTDNSTVSGGINNGTSGALLGNNQGIKIEQSDVLGGITNSGTVRGGSLYGINAINGSKIYDGITNESSGIISGSWTGLVLSTSTVSGGITNSGSIIGNERYGIALVSDSEVDSITNAASGLISGDRTGILISDSTVSGEITNSGSIIGGINIKAHGSVGGITNEEGGVIMDHHNGINISLGTVSGGISNSGTIAGSWYYGIKIGNNSAIIGDITNESGALIIGDGTYSGYGVYISNSSISGSISNSGSIIGDGVFSEGGINISNISLGGDIFNDSTGIIKSDKYGLQIGGGEASISGGIYNNGSIIGGSGDAALSIGTAVIDEGINNGSSGLIYGGVGLSLSHAEVLEGISNSGSIIGSSSYGINMNGNSSVSGGISNAEGGLIYGLASGIKVNDSTLSGGISNSGSIIANDTDGIKISNGSVIIGDITNSAGALISGHDDGIRVTSSSISGGISNSGSILSSIAGILYRNGSLSEGIINETGGLVYGSISGIEIGASATISGGISNSGSIIGDLYTGMYIHESLISGGISNESDALIYGNRTAIVMTYAYISGNITNSGSIIGADIAVNISSGSYVTDGITNTASGVISGGDTGISIDDSVVSGGITNSGTISGGTYAIHLSSLGNDLDIIISGDNAQIIGDVVDDEYANGDSVATISGNFTTQGNWTVSDLTVDSGKTLTISHNDTITLNSMSDSEGTLRFSVLSPEDHATLTVTDGAINLREATVAVNAASATGLADGEEIVIGTGSSTVLGLSDGKNSVTDNSFLYDFKVGDGTNADGGTEDQLYLFVTKNTFTGTAGALANLSDSDNEIVLQTITNLGNASSTEQQRILETLKPTSSGNSFVASQNISNSITNITDTRLASLRDGGSSSGIATGDSSNNKNIWAQGFAQKATQDDRGGVSGYDASTDGVAFGIDTDLDNDAINVGVAFGMSKSDVTSNSLNATSTDVDSYQVSFYSDYKIDDRTFINGGVGFVYGNTTSVKHNVGGTGAYAEGEYGSQQISAQAKLGRNYQLGAAKITLSTLANYINYNEDDYTETGNAGPLLLTVNSKELQKFEMGIGADFSWDFNMDNGYILRPSTSIGYRHDFIDDSFASTATFNGGGTFSTDGLNPADDTIDLGVGLKLLNSDTWNVSIDYGFETREDYNSHTGTVKAGYRF